MLRSKDKAKIKRDIRLLNESIAHHERLRDGKPRKYRDEDGDRIEEPYAEGCALCGEYNKKDGVWPGDCVGCPIAMFTGETYCGSTPYTHVANTYDDMLRSGYDRWNPSAAFRNAEKHEISFLKSVRDALKLMLNYA